MITFSVTCNSWPWENMGPWATSQTKVDLIFQNKQEFVNLFVLYNCLWNISWQLRHHQPTVFLWIINHNIFRSWWCQMVNWWKISYKVSEFSDVKVLLFYASFVSLHQYYYILANYSISHFCQEICCLKSDWSKILKIRK